MKFIKILNSTIIIATIVIVASVLMSIGHNIALEQWGDQNVFDRIGFIAIGCGLMATFLRWVYEKGYKDAQKEVEETK